MVLILFPKRINDVALSFDLSLKVLVCFLDHQNLLLFLLLFFEKLFFTLLLSLQLFLEFPKLASLFFFFLSESITSSDEFLLELFHHVFKLLLLVLGVVEFLLFSFDHRLDLVLLFLLLFKLVEQLRILLDHDLRLRCRRLRWRLHHRYVKPSVRRSKLTVLLRGRHLVLRRDRHGTVQCRRVRHRCCA